MKIYYEKENFPTSSGKIYFTLEGDINTEGAGYVWTLGKGVYGIFEGEELIYIGETMVSFEARMRQHNKAMQNTSSVNKMYKYIKENFRKNKFYMRPLVEIETRVKATRKLTIEEVKAIELGFITCFQPKFNVEGRFKNYLLKKG